MFNRRKFLQAAAASTGYTLIVKGSGAQAIDTPPLPTREEIAEQLEELSPETAKTGQVAAEPNMVRVNLKCDVLVAGGGLAGVCAAISAARSGASVILLQDRSRLGGNASSEVKMHPLGSQFGFRETGIIEELSPETAYHNEHYAWELWDLLLYDFCVREPRLRLLLDTVVYRAETSKGLIKKVWARCDKTEHLYVVESHIYIDATGDARLGLEAGAEFKLGREPVEKVNECHAAYDKPGTTQGSSILFTARKHDRPMGYTAPSWARPITAEDLEFRKVAANSFEYGYWWIELGGVYDTIKDNERLRFELLSIVLGVWDHIKNSERFPEAANWALETVGMIPGKRESRRLVGDYIMTQADIEGRWKELPDGVAFGGWPMDDHPALGFDAPGQKPYRPAKYAEPYNIPLGSLYSKNVRNLIMAGRNISASHVAFTSTRVMKTCAVIGQAAGTAAAACAREKILPRELRSDTGKMKRLQQQLLRDDHTILQQRNEDEADLARAAAVTASGVALGSKPENVISGVNWEKSGEVAHRWIAPLAEGGAWLQLDWPEPVEIRELRLTFDTGLGRDVTMTAQASVQRKIKTGPQPEVVQDYRIVATLADGTEQELARASGNYQRHRIHRFDPVKSRALRVVITGSPAGEARLFGIRAYA